MHTEEWRGIEGYPLYEVSSLGNVRSWATQGRSPQGVRASSPRLLKAATVKKQGSYPYKQVGLYNDKGIKAWLVHQLVATAFHGERPEGMVTRHLNGQPLDNRAENLKWGTPRENALDRFTHGTANFVGGRVAPVLTDLEVIDVYARTQLGETVKEIHAHYPQVSREHIRLIVRGQARQPVIKRWLKSNLLAGAA